MKKQLFPGWLPIQVASHYDFPLAENDGKGQSVAIISLGGKINKDELRKDFQALRIPMTGVRLIDVNGSSISDEQNQRSSAETHLDLEVIASICPQANINVYRASNEGLSGFTTALEAAIDGGNSVISISWGRPENRTDKNSPLEKALRKAKKEGITVCVAAGDGGSSANRDALHAVPARDNRAHVEYPASSPYVLACGGTQLMLDQEGYHEIVWNNSALKSSATGGGISEVFGPQTWQTAHNINIPSVNTKKKGRVIPDVAALASGSWKIFEFGKGEVGGGTSAVAPLYASLFVLANQQRDSQGKAPLGFLNKKLYALAAKGGLFNDITVGNNRPIRKYPGYKAKRGFDACTGWGTPIAAKLFDALVKLP